MTTRDHAEGTPPVGSGPGAVHILHLDMDSFFASVEVRDDPSLSGRPLVVGGSVERGVVASASYVARRYGIRSAMPTAEARRRCPDLLVVPPRHARYGEVSRQLMTLLEAVTPVVEPVALDEAYLDVAGALGRAGPPAALATRLRSSVHAELGLACSVGAGTTKLVAKLASKAAKPPAGSAGPFDPEAGVVVVEPDEEASFLGRHPVRALPGVGPRTAEKLARFGVETVGDLALVEGGSLVRLLGRAHGTNLHDLSHGRDARGVEPERTAVSIGHEETFPSDERSRERLASIAAEMAQAVAARCRAAGVAPRRITVKLRYADFTTTTRSRTLGAPVATGFDIGRVAGRLLDELAPNRGVRLLGVHGSLLVPLGATRRTAQQLSLFSADGGGDPAPPSLPDEAAGGCSPDRARRHQGVELAADAIRRRFGAAAIASLAAVARRPR